MNLMAGDYVMAPQQLGVVVRALGSNIGAAAAAAAAVVAA